MSLSVLPAGFQVFVAGGVRRQPKHPDPVPLALLPQNEEDLGIPADSNANSSCGQQLGGESRGGQRGDVRRRKDASATSSTQSTDRVNLGQKGENQRPAFLPFCA